MKFIKRHETPLTFLMIAFVCVSAAVFVGAYRDQDIDWDVQYTYFPANSFDFRVSETQQSDAQGGYYEAVSAGVGGNLTEVGTLGIIGVEMTAADDVRKVFPVPVDMNRLYPVAFQVLYTSSSSDDDGTIMWKIHSVPSGIEQALTDVLNSGAPATAGWDTIVFAADSSKTANFLRTTAWDTLKVDSLYAYTPNDIWNLSVELDGDGDAAGDEIIFLGLRMAYVPKKTLGTFSVRKANYVVRGATSPGGVNKAITLSRKAGGR